MEPRAAQSGQHLEKQQAWFIITPSFPSQTSSPSPSHAAFWLLFHSETHGDQLPSNTRFYLAIPGRIPRADYPKQIDSQELSDALWTFSVGSLPSAICRYVKPWSLVNVNERKTGTRCLFSCLHFGLLRWWDWQRWLWNTFGGWRFSPLRNVSALCLHLKWSFLKLCVGNLKSNGFRFCWWWSRCTHLEACLWWMCGFACTSGLICLLSKAYVSRHGLHPPL